MSRVCAFCKAELMWFEGEEQTARERAGNARERDTFHCTGCTREYSHIVSERFSGNTQWWSVRERGETTWQELDEEHWPR